MGYANYTIIRNGERIPAGYAVQATCEEPRCHETIDRGLGSLCGEHPGGDGYGCGGYYCEAHLTGAPNGEIGTRCARCMPKVDDHWNRITA